MLGIAIIPLIGAAGAAVDYSRANATRAAFQSALDSAALTLSKTAPTQTPADLQAAALKYVNAVFTAPNVKNVTVTASYSNTAGSQLVLDGSATINTDFMSIFGIDSIDVKTSSTSAWGNTRLRVALVLDNTGSMASSNKMTALKTASQNLLTQLQNAATTTADVYVSIIPFNKDVNVDPSNVSATWLRWDLWDAVNGKCSNTTYKNQSTCVAAGKTWTPNSHTTWNGCVTDRDQNFDTTNDVPVAGSTLYPTEQYSSCPTSLVGLTNDWTALSSKITAMQPVGNTNQALGLQLGWQSLTASPFTVPAMDPNYKYTQVIILLSDGLNTQDRWYSCPNNGPCPTIDGRQQTTCSNIKASGITIYTVQVNTDGSPTSTLLENCASNTTGTTDHFFLLTSSDQIVTTFNQIGTSLSNLRLAM